MADKIRKRRIIRLQVHKFLYRTTCDSCGNMIARGEIVPIGMKDCPERDEFIDAFRTGSMQFLSDPNTQTACESCLLDHIIDDAVDLFDYDPDDDAFG